MNNTSIKHVLFDSVKEKYVTDNRKNRRRLERQNDVAHRVKSSTFMNRLRLKLSKLKLGTVVHVSIAEKKKTLLRLHYQYGYRHLKHITERTHHDESG